ncbi:Uncharacterised protein [Ewingella americana]|uniref:Uncharacterized protein n=1 Tax=Ewingella americana TaxID=41202 RepID=A0A377NEU0_9GAMM|nr:Uncharacterised protein [Ewingella americana]
MEFDYSVLHDNFTYLLWGRVADGEPGGVLLTLIMAISAGAIALALGVGMAALAWRFGAGRGACYSSGPSLFAAFR